MFGNTGNTGLLPLVQRGWAWAGWGPSQSPPGCTKCTAMHPSTASVPTLYYYHTDINVRQYRIGYIGYAQASSHCSRAAPTFQLPGGCTAPSDGR